MPASKTSRFFCSESAQELSIKGKFNTQESALNRKIPSEVISLFDKFPDIEEIAMSGGGTGKVWSRAL